MSDFWL